MTQEEYLEKREKVENRKRVFGFDYRNNSMSADEFVEKLNKIMESHKGKSVDIEFIADDSDENATSIYLTWVDWETFEQVEVRLGLERLNDEKFVKGLTVLIKDNESVAVDILRSLGYSVESLNKTQSL